MHAKKTRMLHVSPELHDLVRVAAALGCEPYYAYLDRCMLPLVRQHIRENAAVLAANGITPREHRRPLSRPRLHTPSK